MKRYNCKICGEYSGKSDTCKKCKNDFPFHPAGKRSYPFNRLNEFIKRKLKERN